MYPKMELKVRPFIEIVLGIPCGRGGAGEKDFAEGEFSRFYPKYLSTFFSHILLTTFIINLKSFASQMG